MSAIDVASLQNLVNSISQLTSTVLWVRPIDYKKQVFVSESVKNIYGFTPEQIFNKPDVWLESIQKNYKDVVYPRVSERIENMRNNIADYKPIFYEVLTPCGKHNFVKNQCYPIVSGKKLLGFYGFGEILQQEQWQALKRQHNHKNNVLAQIGNDIISLLTKDISNNYPAITIDRDFKINQDLLSSSQLLLWELLSLREKECFEQLLLGKTAKETARQLSISQRTVEAHILSIKNKIGCHKKIEIIGKFNNLVQND
jgi:DNA-binding CsgD family transcriptional regulator